MSARRHLSGLQFGLAPDTSGDEYHLLQASHPEHGVVGSMSWAKKDTGFHQAGEISNVFVDPKHQRQGVATAMYRHAVDNISPTPLHSYNQTETRVSQNGVPLGGGKDWAKSVGGKYVPKRYVNGPDA